MNKKVILFYVELASLGCAAGFAASCNFDIATCFMGAAIYCNLLQRR